MHRRPASSAGRGVPVGSGAAAPRMTFIHQDLGLVDGMTVAENVALQAGYPRRGGLIDWRSASGMATKALAALGSTLDPDARVSSLAAADRSIVAIARALACRTELLVLDEPTAALPAADVEVLLGKLHQLRARGIGLIYVTHRLDEVFRVADRITVLRDGRHIATRAASDTDPGELVDWIVGGALADTQLAGDGRAGEVLLSLEDVVVPQEDAGTVGPVSLVVRRGETLGLVGLRGAGHHALGRAVYGAMPVRSGRMTVEGREVRVADPSDAIRHGIGFVSSRRAEESLAPNLTLLDNLYLNSRARGRSPFGFVAPARELAACQAALARFSVRPADPSRTIATLSGGNQQKVVVARWMESNARLLILEEPTIGVDVGSKAEIYRDLREAHARGRGVLLISSDFEEVEKTCHRALVFSRGKVVAEMARQEINVANLTALAAGAGETAGQAA